MNEPAASAAPGNGAGRLPEADQARFACFIRLLAQYLWAGRASHLLVLLTMAVGAMGMAATFFIGDGALTRLWSDMEDLMGSQILILPDPGPNDALLKRRPAVCFTEADLAALRRRVTAARFIGPHHIQRVAVRLGDVAMDVMAEGISPEVAGEEAFRPVLGTGFSTAATAGTVFECLVTRTLEARLGAHVGSRLNVDGNLFVVTGVVPDPPGADTRFQSRLVMPFRTAWLMYGKPGAFDGFAALMNRPEDLDAMLEQVRVTLDEAVGPDCYYLSSSRLTARKRKGVVANVMAFGTAQAFFCVLVASIGVASVMLANVVRRRREYAIRIVMGARQSDIFGLVLGESMLIGLLGGLIGVAAAAGVAPVLCHALASRIQEASSLEPVFGLRGLLVPLAACGISGLLAGIFPALQIRRLDVLSILHTE